jgi:hypothetical protein
VTDGAGPAECSPRAFMKNSPSVDFSGSYRSSMIPVLEKNAVSSRW